MRVSSTTSSPDQGVTPFYVLHHHVHEEWADARLVMWRIGFSPAYSGGEISQAIDEVLNSYTVYSSATYEILGQVDIVVRAWVPTVIDLASIELSLSEELVRRDMRVSSLERNEVRTIHRHWVWCEPGSSEMRMPSEDRLDFIPDPDFLSRLNSTVSGEGDGLSDDELESALAENLLAPYSELEPFDDEMQGIKFIMFITGERLPGDLRRRFTKLIVERLTRLSGLVSDSGERVAHELSLYESPKGESGEFAIFGRVNPGNFYGGLRDLIDFVVRPEYRDLFRVRPVTHILASPNFIQFSEMVPIFDFADKDPLGDLPVEELFDADEGPHLEMKASLFADVLRWVHNDEDSSVERNDQLFSEGIARTVTAFLNSPPGTVGRVVVGALEAGPIERRMLRDPSAAMDEKLQGLPKLGRYWVTGLEPDIALLVQEGKKSVDPDYLARQIGDLLAKQISGPQQLTGRVEVETVQVAGRPVMIIKVRSSAPDNWAYCTLGSDPNHQIFPVRTGPATHSLNRAEEADYKSQFSK